MLRWALQRGGENARDASGSDDTQLEQPDTPAPLFAVRAFKTALFGTPAPVNQDETKKPSETDKLPTKQGLEPKSPLRPGILLTPGTGTSRSKRVSFDRDAKKGAAPKTGCQSGMADQYPGKFPSQWVGNEGSDRSHLRPTKRLVEAIDKSCKKKSLDPEKSGKEAEDASKLAQEDADNVWEEVDDLDRDPDVTVDLNEPHSRSGKYWKSQFEDYHTDAKAEMEKLVKYKQLAKSYAKKKDQEALELKEKLTEEQEKVQRLERQILARSNQAAREAKVNGEWDKEALAKLAKQADDTMAYKRQVKELEQLVAHADELGYRGKRIASPRTQQSLLETQRELRKAKNQVREAEKLREQRDRLKCELECAAQKTRKLAEENRRMANEVSAERSRAQKLQREAEKLEKEARQKDREMQRHQDEHERIKAEHENLKKNAKARYVEAEAVLDQKNEKISCLEAELAYLKQMASSSRAFAPSRDDVPISRLGRDNIKAFMEDTRPKQKENHGDGNKNLSHALRKLRHASGERDLIKDDQKENEHDSPSAEHDAVPALRALRNKLEADSTMRRCPLSNRENPPTFGNASSTKQHERHDSATCSFVSKKRASVDSSEAAKAGVRPFADEVCIQSRIFRTRVSDYEQKAPATAPSPSDSEGPPVGLIETNFARLGVPDLQSSTVWAADKAKSTLSTNRRAAAMARLERKKAERFKERQLGRNMENAVS